MASNSRQKSGSSVSRGAARSSSRSGCSGFDRAPNLERTSGSSRMGSSVRSSSGSAKSSGKTRNLRSGNSQSLDRSSGGFAVRSSRSIEAQGGQRRGAATSAGRNTRSRNAALGQRSGGVSSSTARGFDVRGSSSSRYVPSRRAAGGRYANASSQGTPRQSRSVGEIRREERDRARRQSMERAARKTRMPLIIIGVVIGVVIAAAATFFVLSHTDVFRIEDVQFEGAEHLTQKEMEALVAVPDDATLLNVDADAIKSSLTRVSWVKSVDVNKKYPSTLEVVVHERPMAAVVEIPMGATQTIQNWAIADDGVWLMAIPNEDSEVGQQINPLIYEDVNNVPHITGIQFGLTPELGTECKDENVNNALNILTGMTTELADQVKTISASDSESTQLTLKNNIEIAFGKAENIREKERICLEIMEQNPNVVYINVRVPDRPTFRKI